MSTKLEQSDRMRIGSPRKKMSPTVRAIKRIKQNRERRREIVELLVNPNLSSAQKSFLLQYGMDMNPAALRKEYKILRNIREDPTAWPRTTKVQAHGNPHHPISKTTYLRESSYSVDRRPRVRNARRARKGPPKLRFRMKSRRRKKSRKVNRKKNRKKSRKSKSRKKSRKSKSRKTRKFKMAEKWEIGPKGPTVGWTPFPLIEEIAKTREEGGLPRRGVEESFYGPPALMPHPSQGRWREERIKAGGPSVLALANPYQYISHGRSTKGISKKPKREGQKAGRGRMNVDPHQLPPWLRAPIPSSSTIVSAKTPGSPPILKQTFPRGFRPGSIDVRFSMKSRKTKKKSRKQKSKKRKKSRVRKKIKSRRKKSRKRKQKKS